jgi:hemerythrin-like domain-containing protein
MLIFSVIERDQDNIRKLLSEVKSHKDEIAEDRIRGLIPLIQELRDELSALFHVEKQTIYSKICKLFRDNVDIIRAVEVHDYLANMIDKCINTLEKKETLRGFAQFCFLADMIKHHFQYERERIFDMLRQAYSEEELDKIGEQYETIRIQQSN